MKSARLVLLYWAVQRGLVREPGAWYWSSYRWYAGERDTLLAVDDIHSDS
ncbi:MAG: hypothetical protein JSU65_02860 [Candidatus Zixiibacteriota bacterium]|nr:MAG: hypothetical protein JSU65_02860 [candidate division Zixibacteria bacterium]